jgi:hypothetical protein
MGIEGPASEPESRHNSATLPNAPGDHWREPARGGSASRTLAAVASNDRDTALERAIALLTRRLPFAADDEVTELVRERRAMREELRALREGAAGNVVPLARAGGEFGSRR